MDASPGNNKQLAVTWLNVAYAGGVLLLDVAVCIYFKLGVAQDLLVAAARCVIQLSLLGLVLDSVFSSQSPAAVIAVTLALILLGANEVSVVRASRHPEGLFTSTFISLAASVVPVTTLAARFIIGKTPFWSPDSFIPILGMLTGSAISGSAVAVNYISKEVVVNRDKLETLLAHGASRSEACIPLARDALKLSLLPTINQMSVIGLIAIPGMMTGAILGGADVAQAARMQMVIMFLITACTTLSVCCSVLFVLRTLVDERHCIRVDRISSAPLWPVRAFNKVKMVARQAGSAVFACVRWPGGEETGRVRLQ